MFNLIRTSAFFRKEIFEIVRQPRLLLSLILGPFLILLLFGVGYRNEPQTLRTLIVMKPDNPFRQYLEEYTTQIVSIISFSGIVEDEQTAREQISEGLVDVALILPEDPVNTIRNNQQATFTILHREIDPFNIQYVEVFARAYINEVNRRVLSGVAQEGQQGTEVLQTPLEGARTSAASLREATASGDTATATAYRLALTRSIGLLALTAGSEAGFLTEVGEQFGTSGDAPDTRVGGTIGRLQENAQLLTEVSAKGGNPDEEVAIIEEIESDLDLLEQTLADFSSIEPDIVVRPFTYKVESVTPSLLELADFYVPAVIALLMQHIAITFSALSIVRERSEGSIELFRVAPITSFETLVGKYASYFVFDIVLAIALTLLIVFGLGTPMIGNWLDYWLIMLMLVLASLGIGFVISIVAQTTTQAVQYAMIILLASIFFSGFFLGLQLLWQPIRLISWLLPATYATQMLQDVMLRGLDFENSLMAGMAAMAAAFFALSWLLLRRLMAQR